jgi:hypothetical protein
MMMHVDAEWLSHRFPPQLLRATIGRRALQRYPGKPLAHVDIFVDEHALGSPDACASPLSSSTKCGAIEQALGQ